MSKKSDALTLFGVDLSVFSRRQQTFLINSRYAKTEAELCRTVGVTKRSVTMWKRGTEGFLEAYKHIRQAAVEVDVKAAEDPHIEAMRRQSKDLLADAAPQAAQEIIALAQKPLSNITERELPSKLKACEDILRITGVEPRLVNPGTGRFNVLALIAEIGGEKSKELPKPEPIEATAKVE